MLLIILSIVVAVFLHWFLIRPSSFWKNKGVPTRKPLPLVGNLGKALIFKKSAGEVYRDIYNEFKDFKYVGAYRLRKPVLLARDPEIIRTVLTKNFSNFHDNDVDVDETVDPILARNPFILTGQKWKIVRGRVTANITSGKLKAMFQFITHVGKSLVKYVEENPDATSKDGLETRELAAKFTTDVVASCAFGLEGNSFVDPNAEFRTMGRKMLAPDLTTAVKFMIITLVPSLASIFKIPIIPKDIADWFTGVLTQAIKYRKENNIVRNDYLDFMTALKGKEGEYEFKDIDVIAQCMTFFIDGYETSSVALSFTLYCIAGNPDVQAKLKKEIDTILAKHNEDITYEALQEMNYLDNVISESLRKYAPVTHLAKRCTTAFTFPPPKQDGSGPEVNIPEGTGVIIPVLALHYDPQYYPDPEIFDPDRFSDEVKESRPKEVYLPFGLGPRQCLGFRFALTQIKAAIVSIVKDFEINVTSKTNSPLIIDPSQFILTAKGGLWLNYHKRK